jgi:hypothetical protein
MKPSLSRTLQVGAVISGAETNAAGDRTFDSAHPGADEQTQRRSSQRPWTHAPQSQSVSAAHNITMQPLPLSCTLEGSHRKLTGQVYPASHGTSLHPCTSEKAPDAQVVPDGHTKPSVVQSAGAHPCTSAPARVGAQIDTASHEKPELQGTGSHLPLAAHCSPTPQEFAVHGRLHSVKEGHPP